MGKFSKHIGQGAPLVIDGEEFNLKPLGLEFLPDFFKAWKAFSGAKEGATLEDTLKNITDEGSIAIKRIIDETLKKSFPTEDEGERKVFGMKYVVVLLTKIFELNSAGVDPKDKRLKKAMEKLKSKKSEPNPKV